MSISREVREYAYELVMEGKKLYNQLTEKEKEKFSGLIWSSYPRYDSYSPICDSDFKQEIPYLIASSLKNNDIKLYKKIISIMKNNCSKYFSNTIQNILDEQNDEYKFNLKYDGE